MKFYAVFLFYRCLKRLFPYLELTSMLLFSQKQDYKVALRKYRKALRYLDVCWEKEEIDEGKYTASNTLFKFFFLKNLSYTFIIKTHYLELTGIVN